MIYASVPELRGEDEFELHEGHTFGNDGQRDEAVGEELAEVIDSSVIDFVDAQREPVRAAIRDEFALVGMYLLDEVVEFFQECRRNPDPGGQASWRRAEANSACRSDKEF